VNQAVAASDRGDASASIVAPLGRFIRAASDLGHSGLLTAARVTTLQTLAAVAIQTVTGAVSNVSSGGSLPGAVAPESIASLRGDSLGTSQQEVTILDSASVEQRASVFQASRGRIDYLVPRGTAAGKAIAVITGSGTVISAVTLDVELVSPSLFTMSDGSTAAAVVQRVRPDGSQTYETATGPSILARRPTRWL
jgi:hypothetical protein